MSETPPHLDSLQWDRLIESVGPESILVVISGWLGREVKRVWSAEDVWQETLAQAWRDREQHTWTGVQEYRRWLLSIAHNRVRDAGRRATAAKRGGGDGQALFSDLAPSQADRSLSALLPAGSTTPSRVAGARERAGLMEDALESVSADCAVVLREHLFGDRPMPEVAAELGIGLSAAWYRLRKGSEQYARALSVLRSRSLAAGASAR